FLTEPRGQKPFNKLTALTARLKSRPPSVESHFHVGALFKMDSFDEAHLAIVERQNHGMEANAFAEKTNTTKEAAVGDSGAGEDPPFSLRKVCGVIDALGIFDAHFFESLRILRLGNDEAAEDLSI